MTQVADMRKVMAQVAYDVGGHDPGGYRVRSNDPGSRQEKKHGSGCIRGRRPWPRLIQVKRP
jgi:hypothetical protein